MPPEEQGLPPELQPDYSEDGVDLSLVRWMLSLTPAERLQALEQHSAALEEILKLNATKYRATLPLLRQTLEEQRRRERPVC